MELGSCQTTNPLSFQNLSKRQLKTGLSSEELANLSVDNSLPYSCDHLLCLFQRSCLALTSEERGRLLRRIEKEGKFPRQTLPLLKKVIERTLPAPKTEIFPRDLCLLGVTDEEAWKTRMGMKKVHEELMTSEAQHLLLPTRQADLSTLITQSLPDETNPALLAQRLSQHYSFGTYGLHLQETKRALAETRKKIEEASEQLRAFNSRQPMPIPEVLEADMLPWIRGDSMRQGIANAYQYLKETGHLDVLDLDNEELLHYENHTDASLRHTLGTLTEQWKKTSSCGCAILLNYLKPLRSGLLSSLEEFCLREELRNNQQIEEMQEKSLQQAKTARLKALQNLERNAKDFRPGNFDFLDQGGDSVLAAAYNSVEKHNLWRLIALIDLDSRDDNYETFVFGQILFAMNDDGFSGPYSPLRKGMILGCMKKIHLEGWEAFVADYLSTQKEDIGVLQTLPKIDLANQAEPPPKSSSRSFRLKKKLFSLFT